MGHTYTNVWGNYIPEIYNIARALLAMQDSDEEAAQAWSDRMQAMLHGCNAAIRALKDEQLLLPDYSQKQVTDILWTILSVRNWEQLTLQ